MIVDGVLSPSESGKFIVEHGSLVKINRDGVGKVAVQILEAAKDGSIKEALFLSPELHPKSGDKDAVQWVFLVDTINFSFWPDEGKHYDVSWGGKSYTGYFSACAAVNKAIAAGIPVLSAKWMKNATTEIIDEIFKSDSGHSIPLLEERVKAINDSGRVLLEKFDGEFYNCVVKSEKSAQKLLQLIVENFESFRDFAEFNGQKVSLLKRAQILVADVYGSLQGHDEVGDFNDISTITMFADYRVPQALAYLGALDYSQDLLNQIGEGKRLENGSKAEVELRGASIAVCDEIVAKMNQLRAEDLRFADVREVTAMEVDVFVWGYRRLHAADVEKQVPFHRTRCIYY
uniref:Queuosine 5'-phosphate N-glycosylase/hydrolase n=1 Tax=Caenorhabditis tropicalis TaxID=1561998 RepID=A0A1I7UM56_9PELO